ncbi:hypothetical protein BDFB_015322 [Asbolus verrucosus]|uniref:Uncharacterized protein n=1 Tax=Asbolus verrucosus TaxID=1661398 RepID=A0A482V7N1_ASBVE|nr:hypothetical protein BDFB_015322 [Asbolus verrucosus]
MAFTGHHKRCTLEMYFRNSEKIDGQWIYSTRNAFEDFREIFPDVIVTFEQFVLWTYTRKGEVRA